MAVITFYEKPGCAGNAKQKALLVAAGHELMVRNLLTQPWTADALLRFFGELPVRSWFNQAAPRIKSGELKSELLSPEQAIQELVREPLLIRRPLMQSGASYRVGFDAEDIDAWVGLPHQALPQNLEGCAANMTLPEAEALVASSCGAHSKEQA